jgi:hypothetical protein
MNKIIKVWGTRLFCDLEEKWNSYMKKTKMLEFRK